MYSSNIQVLLMALILAVLATLTAATSYDKYDPGYGIYDDGFSNDNYPQHYRSVGPKYAVKHAGHHAIYPTMSRTPPGRMKIAYAHPPAPQARQQYAGYY